MPLSEFYGTSKRMVEGSSSTDLAFVPNNGLVELVYENGHITMHDQSINKRAPKIHTSNSHFQTPTYLEKDITSHADFKVGKCGEVDSIYTDNTSSAPSTEPVLNQDDEMAQWFNYPINDTLQQDYCYDLLPELSGVTANESSMQNSFASIGKRDRYNQVRNSHNGSVQSHELSFGHGSISKAPPPKYAPLYPWSLPEGQTSGSTVGSRVSEIMSSNNNNIQNDVSRNLVSFQAPAGHLSHMNMQKQDSGLPRRTSSLLNFSHFSRPAAVARANIQNASAVSALVSSTADRMVENDTSAFASCRNPAESTQLDPNCVLRKEMNCHTRSNLVTTNSTKVDFKRVETIDLDESLPRGRSHAVPRGNGNINDKSSNLDLGGNTAIMLECKNGGEPVCASLSLCSGNSVERTSNDRGINLKRKNCRDTEESECQSEDVEEESVGFKKTAHARGGLGSKRSRAAEVHNLSERRRRDRINEKIRALQELIPNCNKVDKASMLDEAIEYLKTLQLQVQMMSMGAGMYMPPMMLPTGMQHIHPAYLQHISPMGVGMGMGMGFGMNMLDLNGGPQGCSMIPLSPMQGAHFPSPSMSRASRFQGMAGGSLPVIGHPSQGFPMSLAGGHSASVSGQPPINSVTGMNTLKMGFHVESPNAVSSPNVNSKNLTKNTNLQEMHSAEAMMPLNQQSSQLHETNDEFDQSALMRNIDQGADVGGSRR